MRQQGTASEQYVAVEEILKVSHAIYSKQLG